MIAEVLIFVPSVSNFRQNWLMERVLAAQIASLAAEAAPGNKIPKELNEELLKSAGVLAVALRRADKHVLVLSEDMPHNIEAHYDLRNASSLELIRDAIHVLFSTSDRLIRVVAKPKFAAGEFIEVIIHQRPLHDAMLQFGFNILLLSIVISVFTAALVYFALNSLLVRPIMRITRHMTRFSQDPENPANIISVSNRTDEIGVAERELSSMQRQLLTALQQKNRLAVLGLAVSKIAHDLRNMLASAQLISDRFETIDNPTVQRVAPKLVSSLDRAISLCTETLKYGSVQETPPARTVFPLEPLLREVGEALGLPKSGRIVWRIEMDTALKADADRTQLFRILSNLCRNALQVLQTIESKEDGEVEEISVHAFREKNRLIITVSDSGPGLSKKARENLFEPFSGSDRKGGTGLGLVISTELIRAHGGEIKHVETESGATFRIAIPDSSENKREHLA